MTGPWFLFRLRGAYGQYSTTDGIYGQDSAGKGMGSGAKIITGLGSYDVNAAPLDSLFAHWQKGGEWVFSFYANFVLA